MSQPGEVKHWVGRSYVYLFAGALQGTVPHFRHLFDVETSPDKVTFTSRKNKEFSFDFAGVIGDGSDRREVFCEAKGYSKAADLLAQYKEFLAKSYVASYYNHRHRRDSFWFIANVPFACSEGVGILSDDYLRRVFESRGGGVKEIIGDEKIDEDFLRDLQERLGVFILMDSYLQRVEIIHYVKKGETVWEIMKILHGGRQPRVKYANFRDLAEVVARRSGLSSPDIIRPDDRLVMSWYGFAEQ